MPIPTLAHYDFTGWVYNEEKVFELYVVKDIHLTATWELTTYQIIFEDSIGNVIPNLEVRYGDTIEELPPIYFSDFVFNGWTFEGNVVTLPFQFEYDHDVTFTSSWTGNWEGFTLGIKKNEVEIIKYVGTDSEVVIPDTILDLPVTSLGSASFMNSTITSIVIGYNVTVIKTDCFKQCRILSSVTIPDSVTAIEPCAFMLCSSLESITLPNRITKIEQLVFYGARLLSITIPDSVTSIGESAFS